MAVETDGYGHYFRVTERARSSRSPSSTVLRVHVGIPEYFALEDLAEEQGVSVDVLVQRAVREYLQRHSHVVVTGDATAKLWTGFGSALKRALVPNTSTDARKAS